MNPAFDNNEPVKRQPEDAAAFSVEELRALMQYPEGSVLLHADPVVTRATEIIERTLRAIEEKQLQLVNGRLIECVPIDEAKMFGVFFHQETATCRITGHFKDGVCTSVIDMFDADRMDLSEFSPMAENAFLDPDRCELENALLKQRRSLVDINGLPYRYNPKPQSTIWMLEGGDRDARFKIRFPYTDSEFNLNLSTCIATSVCEGTEQTRLAYSSDGKLLGICCASLSKWLNSHLR